MPIVESFVSNVTNVIYRILHKSLCNHLFPTTIDYTSWNQMITEATMDKKELLKAIKKCRVVLAYITYDGDNAVSVRISKNKAMKAVSKMPDSIERACVFEDVVMLGSFNSL